MVIVSISAGEFICVPGQSVGIPRTFLSEWEMERRTEDGGPESLQVLQCHANWARTGRLCGEERARPGREDAVGETEP